MNNVCHLLLLIFLCQACKVQEGLIELDIPRIANHTKGELDIKVTPFGLDGPKIDVGKVASDGSLSFEWPDIDTDKIADSEFYMGSIKNAVGMGFCNNKQIEAYTETAKVSKLEALSLYKEGRYVGALYPSTDPRTEDNGSLNRHSSLVLGSTLYWYYSDSDALFKAQCDINMQRESVYDFIEVTTYDIQFIKGWNIVAHTLVDKEDWKSEDGLGSFPKTTTQISVVDVPSNINWYVKYFGM